MAHEFDGRKYEQASAHQKEWGTKLIAEIGLRGSERVLDLGCGDGKLTAQIAELAPDGEVLGIDASRGMIEAALPKARKNLRFLLMDIRDIDFAEQFDLVFSNATLHWVSDHPRMLQRVRRALCDGGRLRFNFAGDGNCATFCSVVREAMSSNEFAPHFAAFKWPWYMPSVDDYSEVMDKSGMKGTRVWGENADRFFADAQAMTKWIDQPSLVPFVAHVPEGSRSAFRDYVVRNMVEKTRQPDGRCFETFRRINAVAQK